MPRISFGSKEPVFSQRVASSQSAATTKEVLKREQQVIEECCKLEGFPLTDFAHKAQKNEKMGFYGALHEAREMKSEKKFLDTAVLSHWHHWIVSEQQTRGYKPTGAIGKIRQEDQLINKVDQLMKELENRLDHLSQPANRIEVAALMGDVYHSFMLLHPFSDANDSVAVLLMNYIANRTGVPPIIINAEEKETLIQARDNKVKMRCFMANKIQDAVFIEESIFLKVNDYGPSSSYKNSQGKEMIIEWHDLIHAIHSWKKEN